MASHALSKGLAALAALALALMIGASLALPAQALASEPSLAVGTQSDEVKTINTTKTVTWVKAGKKLYQWANYEKKPVNGTLRLREGMSLYFETTDSMGDDKISITNVTTSNKSIINPKAVAKYYYMKYTSKKFGTATVTYTMSYTNDAGEAVIENVTENHRVAKYVRPVKSFKIGSKNYAGKFKSTPQVNAKSALKGKISVKPAAGWTIKKIRKVNSKMTSGELIPQKKLANNKSKVNIGKSAESAIEVICYNKAKKYYSSVILTPNFTYTTIAG